MNTAQTSFRTPDRSSRPRRLIQARTTASGCRKQTRTSSSFFIGFGSPRTGSGNPGSPKSPADSGRSASDTAGTMPSRRQLAVALGYVAAAAVYIAIGVSYTDFLLSYFVGLGYLLLVAWLVPAGVRRLF